MGIYTNSLGVLQKVPSRRRTVLSVLTDPKVIAILTIAGIFVHLILRYLLSVPEALWEAPLVAVLIVGGVPLVLPLARKLLAR